MTTDYKALCAELVAALEIQLDELHFNNRLCVRARAALAEPEPPADGEVAEFVAQLKRYAEEGTPLRLVPSVVARAADLLERLAPQPGPEGPSDEELLELSQFCCVSYLLSDGTVVSPFVEGTDMRSDVLSFARAVLARWGQP